MRLGGPFPSIVSFFYVRLDFRAKKDVVDVAECSRWARDRHNVEVLTRLQVWPGELGVRQDADLEGASPAVEK